MQLSNLIFSLLSVASVTLAAPANAPKDTLVQSNQLRRVLTRSALLDEAARFQSFADADPDKNRAFGGVGHNLTVNYLYDTFKKMSDYYTVEFQEFVHEYAYGTSRFTAEGAVYGSAYFTYSPSTNGDITSELANTLNLGCEESDYPTSVAGKIALVSRGSCEFGLKSVLAGKAGAKAVLIYNNVPGAVTGGTYGSPVRDLGPYVPGVMISVEAGQQLKADIEAGKVLATLNVDSVLENRTTYNVIAQTKGGDQNNVIAVGGHTDSVGAGPGINDDGSGSIGILEIAKQLPKWTVKNALRFCFWSAEEFGLVGSEYYVTKLPVEEQNKIRLYINVDMIASPNYAYFIYDGDGSAFNLTGPAGSAEIEHLFEDYFSKEVNLPSAPTAFDGRSDYGPFLDAGIPAGGLFTGAEGIKTEAQAKLFGGEAGVAYDVNYHGAGDNIKNVNVGAWVQNTKAVAHALATYGRSLETIPKRAPAKAKRQSIGEKVHSHHSHCGHEDALL